MSYVLRGGEEWVDGVLHGWTGRKCPRCDGHGVIYSPGLDNEARCPACGGTGDEYGVMPHQPDRGAA